MKIQIEAGLIKEQITLLNKMLFETNIYFKEDGMTIISMDGANVCLAYYHVPREAFSVYELECEKKIGMKLDFLSTILKKIKPNEMFTLTERNNEVMALIGEREFGIPNLEIEIENEQKDINLKMSCKVIFKVKDLLVALDDISYLYDKNTTNLSVLFSYDGTDKMLISAEKQGRPVKSPQAVKCVDFVSKVECMYASDYLENALTDKIGEEVEFSYGKAYPCIIKYVSDKFELRFVIAPRVENN